MYYDYLIEIKNIIKHHKKYRSFEIKTNDTGGNGKEVIS